MEERISLFLVAHKVKKDAEIPRSAAGTIYDGDESIRQSELYSLFLRQWRLVPVVKQNGKQITQKYRLMHVWDIAYL